MAGELTHYLMSNKKQYNIFFLFFAYLQIQKYLKLL